MMYTPEENAALAAYRAKAANGTLTKEDLRHAISILRQKRLSAVQDAARKRKVAASSTRSAEDLLGELEG